jgi:ethanolamine utilization protein EutN
MRIADVIGTVTLNRSATGLRGARFLIAVPLPLERLLDGAEHDGEELVVYDELGAGPGSRIALSEGREAAQPFGETETAIDAYNAAILDRLDVKALEEFAP